MPQELLGARQSQGNVRGVEVLHVVRALEIFHDVSPSGGAERFDGEYFVFFHFGDVIAFDDGDRFAGMDLVGSDRVTIEVAYALDRISLPVQLHLVTFHDLLHALAHIAQPDIDPRRLNPRIRRLLHRLQQRIVLGIERHRPRAIDDPSVDLRAEVHLHDVIVRQYGIVPDIGGVMRRDVIEAASGGKADAALEAFLPYEGAIRLLEALAHVHELYARLDEGLGGVADLTMDLGSVTELRVQVGGEAFVLAKFR
mmetsp:Transcript_32861/g.79525  ORF Transcript_32861/g.79525 Transcript_32861/m.79525 type:complete len:254 (+) Transcript_32861:662-1423(+)